MPISRRTFCSGAAALLSSCAVAARAQPSQSTSRPDVAAIDHDRILKAAQNYLTQAPKPLTALPSKRNPGSPRDYYSEAEDYWPDPAKPDGPYVERTGQPNPDAFTAHRDALLHMSMQVPALAAAFVLIKEQKYADHAVEHLRAWFVDPATSMVPSLRYAQTIPPAKEGRYEGVVEAVHLAEVAQAIPFLAQSPALTKADLDGVQAWFAAYSSWLTTSRLGGLARDDKSHHGSSWLLQACAFARMQLSLSPGSDDTPLSDLRHRYKSVTLRAQIAADGSFPHELTTRFPYRFSLFNLDMLAGVCQLLYTPFASVWDFYLQDGPGMRSAIAWHFPYITDRKAWPYEADARYFDDLPLRCPSLLFCARAYARPEYADLWKTLPADTGIAALQQTFPIRQPLLWVARLRP